MKARDDCIVHCRDDTLRAQQALDEGGYIEKQLLKCSKTLIVTPHSKGKIWNCIILSSADPIVEYKIEDAGHYFFNQIEGCQIKYESKDNNVA